MMKDRPALDEPVYVKWLESGKPRMTDAVLS
jgi:hypothetical protein